MYNKHLDTFIQAADSGSFLQAAKQLYISPNAVTKQINLLESHLNVKLFHRSPQGLALTEAGKLVYAEAKKMIRQSHTVLQKAQELENRSKYIIRIGVSLMNPAAILLEQWNRAAKLYPQFRLEIVPFEDTVPAFLKVLDSLGQKIDLLSCPYDTNYWGDRYRSFHLKDIPVQIACAKSHPLAEKTLLTPEDLHGRTLLLSERNVSANAAALWADLETNHPQIRLKAIDYVDVNLFNQIVTSDELLCSGECWNSVHPLIATIPVAWEHTIPYGLIYSQNPTGELLDFLKVIDT